MNGITIGIECDPAGVTPLASCLYEVEEACVLHESLVDPWVQHKPGRYDFTPTIAGQSVRLFALWGRCTLP